MILLSSHREGLLDRWGDSLERDEGVKGLRSVGETMWGLRIDQPEPLLLDLQLPELGGPNGVEMIRRTHPELKLVALSDSPTEIEESGLLAIGVDGYLDALVESDMLRKAVRGVCAGELWSGRHSIALLIEHWRGSGEAAD